MKKLAFTLFTTSILLASTVFGADDFALGKAAFAKKDYKQANHYLVQYLTKNPNDANARYYYAQTLTYLKNYKQARLEYGYVMQLAPGTMVANYAQASLFFLDKTLDKTADKVADKTANNSGKSPATAEGGDKTANSNNSDATDFSVGDNYLSKTISGQGEINTWNTEKMPIKIFIDMSLRPKSIYVQSFKNAIATWQAISDGLLSFAYVTDSTQANVVVQIKGTPPKAQNATLGWTSTDAYEGYIKSASIIFYTLDTSYKAINSNDFYNVALHEIGHMLGIDGHSDEESDVMFPSYDKAGASAVPVHLSPRDINTFKAMYALDKNPYATGVNSLNKVLGSKTERLNSKLQDELDYAQKFPNNPNSYINLALSYELQNMDAEAVDNYKKALALEPLNRSANVGLARMYFKRNDLKNAEVYYKNLIKGNPKEVEPYCDLTNLYIKNGKYQLAKSTLSSLIYRNPAAKNDPNVQALQSRLNMIKK